jgi:hypothetical protein
MSSDRATMRPVTLPRLVEVTHTCADGPTATADVEARLDVSRRRARSTILEALRTGLIKIDDSDADTPVYEATSTGTAFIDAVQTEAWDELSTILRTRSPHYGIFLEVLEETHPIDLDDLLVELEAATEYDTHTFNEATIDVVGDWAERLGRVNRNAFTGAYYPVKRSDVPDNFPFVLLSVFDDLEAGAGVDLRQRYLSIPELRETVCERLCCRRAAFDDTLIDLVGQNVGKLELSGAPIDTGAKEAQYGIKQIAPSSADGLVSTTQSTEAVMAGVEQFDKRYYYLAVHDRDITYDPEAST